MQYYGCIFTTLHELTGLPQPTRQFMYKRLMGMFHRKLRPSSTLHGESKPLIALKHSVLSSYGALKTV